MQKTFTKEERAEALRKLPERAQDAALSDATADAFHALAEQYDLRVDESGALADESNLLLVGLVKPDEFVVRLRAAMPARNAEEVALLARDANERLFKPVHAALVSAGHGEDIGASERSEDAEPVKTIHDSPPFPALPPTGRTPGVGETMQKAVLEAKFKTATHSPPAEPELPSRPAPPARRRYPEGADPYREQVESD